MRLIQAPACAAILAAAAATAAPSAYAAIIAEQNFNGADASATFTTDSLPDGSQLTNASANSNGAPGLGYAAFWFTTQAGPTGPLDGSESGDFIGANAFGGSNAPDVGPDGTAVAAGVEQNYEFNDTDGRVDLVFDVVDLSDATNRSFSLNYWINVNGYEAADNFSVTLSDGATDEVLLSFGEPELEGMASADDGSANWQTLQVDLEPLLAGDFGDQVTLTVSVDTNSGTENVFIDNVRFESGATAPPPMLVINEIMQNPSAVADGDGEWFELFNAGTADVDLNGFTVRDDGADSFTINTSVVVAAGGFAVLGNNGDSMSNGGVSVDFVYGGDMFLSNSDDELVLEDTSGTEVDRVAWDGGPMFPDPTGASMALTDPMLDNNIGSNWIVSSSPLPGGDLGTPGAANDGPVIDATLISAIQGSGTSSPLLGQSVVIEGIVVGDFQDDLGTDGDVNGFYVQEEDADSDGDASTSEGVFVFQGNNPSQDVARGDLVRVSGTVSEFFGETQVSAGMIEVISTGNALPAAAELSLPFASAIANFDGELIADLEAYEGMLVSFPQTLFVTELFNLDRFGELRLASDGRLFQFTNSNLPDMAGFATHLDTVARSNVMLDDGLLTQNPDPIRYPAPGLDSANPVRMGDGVTGLTGVVRFSRGTGGFGDELYRILPIEEPEFEALNLRPTAPQPPGSLTVTAFNVLNFFNDLDDASGMCFPSFTDEDCRGADNAAEFDRQLEKLITALTELDADVLGLVEIENDYTEGAGSSIAELTAALNAPGVEGTATNATDCTNYAYVDPGSRVGDDAIAVGVIYCADTVAIAPGTSAAILTDAALPGLGLGDLSPVFDGEATSRAPLAVSFQEIATGEVFTIAVNHFKSKGASILDPDDTPTCNTPSAEPNCDQGDGQGFWNPRRASASLALATWLATDPTGSGDPDVMILGDLNAYRQEDPITTLKMAGFADVIDAFGGGASEPYTFVFDGQAGVLDYALASPSLLDQISGAAIWPVNADEADALDYNTDFGRNPAIFDGSIPYRASDHDPVMVGLNLASIPPTPTVAGVIVTVMDAIAAGELMGNSNRERTAMARLGRFLAVLTRAGAAEADGKTRRLCRLLPRLIDRTDGAKFPTDWVKGEATAAINAELQAVADANGCR